MTTDGKFPAIGRSGCPQGMDQFRGRRPRRSRLHQPVQLSRPLPGLGAGREPEAFRARPDRYPGGIANVGLSDRVRVDRADVRRSRRSDVPAATDRLRGRLLEHRDGAVRRRVELHLAVRGPCVGRRGRSRLRHHRPEPLVGLLSAQPAWPGHGDFLLRHPGGFSARIRRRRSDGCALRLAHGLFRRRHPRYRAGASLSRLA